MTNFVWKKPTRQYENRLKPKKVKNKEIKAHCSICGTKAQISFPTSIKNSYNGYCAYCKDIVKFLVDF